MFQRSYLDTIKLIKKKESKKAQLPIIIDSTIGKFESDDILDENYWYQKETVNFIKPLFGDEKHTPAIDAPTININSEKYEPLLGNDGFLSTIFHINNPDEDFLTACYIGQFVKQSLQYDEVFQSYILGANRPSLIRGLHCIFHSPMKWTWFGTDKYHAPPIPPNYLNGVFNKDIRDVNVIHNISIQLAEKTNNLLLVVCDIKPISMVDLYISLAMILNASDRGQGFMRMPPRLCDKFTHEQLAAFYLLVSYLYKGVVIHKTTWTKERKFYLQLNGVKIRRKDKYRMKIIKFIEKLMLHPQLYIFHEDLIKEKYSLTTEDKSTALSMDVQNIDDKTYTDEQKNNQSIESQIKDNVIPFDKDFLSYLAIGDPDIDGDVIIDQWLEFMKVYLK